MIWRRTRTLDGQRREWTYSWDALDRLDAYDTGRRSLALCVRRLGGRVEQASSTQGRVVERVDYTWDGAVLAEQVRRFRVRPKSPLGTGGPAPFGPSPRPTGSGRRSATSPRRRSRSGRRAVPRHRHRPCRDTHQPWTPKVASPGRPGRRSGARASATARTTSRRAHCAFPARSRTTRRGCTTTTSATTTRRAGGTGQPTPSASWEASTPTATSSTRRPGQTLSVLPRATRLAAPERRQRGQTCPAASRSRRPPRRSRPRVAFGTT